MTINEAVGLAMLVSMVSVIFIGFPMAFTLLFLSFVFGSLALGADMTFYLAYLQIWGTMKDDILPAVPLFIFMGFITERSGLMERLFVALRNAFAPVRGSLYVAVILTAMLFAMATGIVGAAVTVLGIMAAPIMIKSAYDARMSAGAIAAGGTLGILIPPSVMLVVMGPVMGVPVNLLYAAAMGPGFLLAACYIAYCLFRSMLNPKLGPPVPRDERAENWRELVRELAVGVVPLAALVTFTLGSILAGLATPTEAASIGAFGAILLALCYRSLDFNSLKHAGISTVTTSSMVLFLAVASNVFGAVFTRLGTSSLIANTLTALPIPDLGIFLAIMVLIFLLGWPFEWPAVILVFLPIFMPVIQGLDLGLSPAETLLWFGAVVAVNLQTAFLSPPVAMSAYYLRNVVPEWRLATIYWGMGQFMIIQIVCLLLLIFFPVIALWLPRALYG